MNAYTQFIADELAKMDVYYGDIVSKSGPTRKTIMDSKQLGFGRRIYKSGRSVYIVQTVVQGVNKTITICNTKYLSRQDALNIARNLILQAQTGLDPVAKKKRKKQTPTFREMLDEFWKRRAPHWASETLVTHNSYRRTHLNSAFPGMLIDEITRADVQRFYTAIVGRGTSGAANRAFDLLKSIFNRAIDWGYLSPGTNPCNDLKKIKRPSIAKPLSDEEYCRLGAALDQTRDEKPFHYASMLVLLFTGCRKSEITTLRWKQVKLKTGMLMLEKTKTGDRQQVLGEAALNLLKCLKPGGPEDYVWKHSRRNKPIYLDNYWDKVRKMADLDGLRIHDARHSFASKANRMSESTSSLQALLGHAKYETTAGYVHQDDSDLIDDAEKIGAILMGLLREGPLPSDANI